MTVGVSDKGPNALAKHARRGSTETDDRREPGRESPAVPGAATPLASSKEDLCPATLPGPPGPAAASAPVRAGMISTPSESSAPLTGASPANHSTTCRMATAVLNANHARLVNRPITPSGPPPTPPTAWALRDRSLFAPASGPNSKKQTSVTGGPQMCAVSSRTSTSGGSAPSTSRNLPEKPVAAIMRSMPPEMSSVPNSWPPNILSATTNAIASGTKAARAREGESRGERVGGATEDSRRSPPTFFARRPFGFFSRGVCPRSRRAGGDAGEASRQETLSARVGTRPRVRAPAGCPRALPGTRARRNAPRRPRNLRPYGRVCESRKGEKKETACRSLVGGIFRDCSSLRGCKITFKLRLFPDCPAHVSSQQGSRSDADRKK